ncbi:unnamed protein product [Zymoseptoria tritici ST99CH_1E4]|uniref:Uncharacterized protein n=1 Tax=Zymoseptoria tritici ST99CH_1E4 TaxID=1276532 RepID=A0A2H1FYL7_ZYMTR|nr:unnamed protein product [Zymoseptoria tritici ST99CH_1E4]
MDGGSSALDNPKSSRQDRRRTADLKDSVRKEDLSAALLDRDADAVAQCLLTAIRLNDLDFVRDIPKTTFSEIIRCLDARHFVAELGNIHVDLSSVAASSMNVAPMREVAFEYASVLRQVLAIRRAAGTGGTLADSRTLLRCARDLGNRKMAELIWSNLMSQRLTPDIQCYNYYMSATVWNGMHLAGFRQKVRVIPFFQMARKSGEYKDRRYKDYSVGENGVLESTMRIFNEMVARNIAADEESFRILIVAAAREGDMKTVKAILKRVWSIDVDIILASGDTPQTLPKPMPTNSPLYPQSTLLFTIAHAFGINNDVSAAIRLVDFVARHYRLQISKDVWGQLFEWTFVLSIRRHGTSTNDGSREGQITSDSVQKLWQTMTGPPYFVKPTMGMYNYMIKSLFLRQMSGRIADLLNDEVRGLYTQQRKQTRFLLSSLKHNIASKNKAMGFRRRRWELQDLVGQRNNFWIRRWIRLLLGSFTHTYRLINIKEQYARSLPRLLWNWRNLVPTNVRYETPTGMVQLEFRSEQELIDAGLANYASKMRIRKMLEPTARVVGESWTQRTPHLTRRLAEAAGVQPTRSNTVKTYHDAVHIMDSSQPGAEPGIDTHAEADKVPPHLAALKEACDINIIDFSDKDVRRVQADNESLASFLDMPRTEDLPCRWISVNGLSYDVIRVLGNKYDLHGLALEDLVHTHTRTKVDWYADHAFIVLTLQKLVRLHQHEGSGENCDCNDSLTEEDEEDIDAKFEERSRHSRKWWRWTKKKEPDTLPRYLDRNRDGKLDEFVTAHNGISDKSPLKAIRTLQRYESAQIPEHTAWMEKQSALTEEKLAVSVEQVSIFLLSDNMVISFFERSASDVEEPILERLDSPATMLRRSCDASLVVQAIIDAIVDLGVPIKDAYNMCRKELQIDAMTNPNTRTSRSLHIFGEEVDMLQNLFKPIVHLVNSLRDHNSEPSPIPAPVWTPSFEREPPKQESTTKPSKRDRQGVPATNRTISDFRRIAKARADTATSVTITPLAHTYFGDVLDHCITMISALEQMDASANNISTLIFNTVGARTNNFMMILAVVTVFFAPLTFISGYFGMNFSSGAGLAHPFAFFWVVAIPSLIAFMLLVFGFMLWDNIQDWLARRGLKAHWGRRARASRNRRQ